MKLLYIASPYAELVKQGRKEEALKSAKELSRKIAKLGFIPINPLALFEEVYDENEQREEVMRACLKLLEKCEVFLVNTELKEWRTSKGIKIEKAQAIKQNCFILKY